MPENSQIPQMWGRGVLEVFSGKQDELRDCLTFCASQLRKGHGVSLGEAVTRLPHRASVDSFVRDGAVAIVEKTVGLAISQDQDDEERLRHGLQEFHPWRKGPFDIFGVKIDSEWRSDWKWDRISPHMPNQSGAMVLDIGCGNGYYMFRMLDQQPKLVVGIDPFVLYAFQFLALQKYIRAKNLEFLPVGLDRLPKVTKAFDTVLCLGVLYHRKSPIDFLRQVFELLKPGGTLILETLCIAGSEDMALVPAERYAKMHNCFLVPTASATSSWLERAGFSEVICVDTTVTTTAEQRSTEWMRFESLSDFLDPTNSAKTIEGYPAPMRCTFSCKR